MTIEHCLQFLKTRLWGLNNGQANLLVWVIGPMWGGAEGMRHEAKKLRGANLILSLDA